MSLGPLPLVQTVAGWSLDGEDGDGMPGCEAPVPAGLRWRTPRSVETRPTVQPHSVEIAEM